MDYENLLASQNGREGKKIRKIGFFPRADLCFAILQIYADLSINYVLPSFIFLFPATIPGGFLDVPAKLKTRCNSCRNRTHGQAAQC